MDHGLMPKNAVALAGSESSEGAAVLPHCCISCREKSSQIQRSPTASKSYTPIWGSAYPLTASHTHTQKPNWPTLCSCFILQRPLENSWIVSPSCCYPGSVYTTPLLSEQQPHDPIQILSALGSSQATILEKLRSKRSPKSPPRQIISPAHPHTDLWNSPAFSEWVGSLRP